MLHQYNTRTSVQDMKHKSASQPACSDPFLVEAIASASTGANKQSGLVDDLLEALQNPSVCQSIGGMVASHVAKYLSTQTDLIRDEYKSIVSALNEKKHRIRNENKHTNQ